MKHDPEAGISRRAFLLAGLNAAAIGAFFHSRWIEPFWPEVSRTRIVLNKRLRRPVLIAHITDFHAFGSMPLWHLENCFNLIAQEAPDLICITGDIVDGARVPAEHGRTFVRLLGILSSAAPTFACLGNHDGGAWTGQFYGPPNADEVLAALGKAGIRCLVNEAELTAAGEERLIISATADLWSGPIAFEGRSRELLREEVPVIMLAHNPDTKEKVADLLWDVMLCGHTHGGQMMYPLSNKTPFYVANDRRFLAGLYQWGARWINVSRGLGSSAAMRVNCPPEISLITLAGRPQPEEDVLI